LARPALPSARRERTDDGAAELGPGAHRALPGRGDHGHGTGLGGSLRCRLWWREHYRPDGHRRPAHCVCDVPRGAARQTLLQGQGVCRLNSTIVIILIAIALLVLAVIAFLIIRRQRYFRALRGRGWIFESRPALESVLDHHAPPFGLGFVRKVDEAISGTTRTGVPFRGV